MCQRGDKRSVLQGHRVKAFALAAYVNPNNCRSYLIHREASAHRQLRRIHPHLTALVPLQQRAQHRIIRRAQRHRPNAARHPALLLAQHNHRLNQPWALGASAPRHHELLNQQATIRMPVPATSKYCHSSRTHRCCGDAKVDRPPHYTSNTFSTSSP